MHVAAGAGLAACLHQALLPAVAAAQGDAHAPDARGATPLHAAARGGHAGAVAAMLAAGGAADAADADGATPAHACAHHGCAATARLLATAPAGPAALAALDGRGRAAWQVACGRGHWGASAALGGPAAPPPGAPPPPPGGPTLVLAPPGCDGHAVCATLERGGRGVPPENGRRLRALNGPTGALRLAEFAHGERVVLDDACDRRAQLGDVRFGRGWVGWVEGVEWRGGRPAGCAHTRHPCFYRLSRRAQVLRVHEWGYVLRLRDAVWRVPAGAVGRLDGDTAVASASWDAALAAAGAVCEAVDRVVRGEARNAFCAVRPPGHHAGPFGPVSPTEPPGSGSHGFCLLNSVASACEQRQWDGPPPGGAGRLGRAHGRSRPAPHPLALPSPLPSRRAVGAAYALCVHRNAFARVAVVDFDGAAGEGTPRAARRPPPASSAASPPLTRRPARPCAPQCTTATALRRSCAP